MPLFTSTGQIRNVVRRRLPELGEPKVIGLKGCPTAGTLLGAVTAIAAERPAVVVEGVADALTAAIAWPKAAVLGAHGACNLQRVVEVAARFAVRRGARLVLVPHNDRAGHHAAVEAGELAIEAGLSVRAGTLTIAQSHGKARLMTTPGMRDDQQDRSIGTDAEFRNVPNWTDMSTVFVGRHSPMIARIVPRATILEP